MSTMYCPHCGAKLTYEAVKPAVCRCGKNPNMAFQPVVAKVVGGVDEVATEPLERPLGQPLTTRAGITTAVKPRIRHGQPVVPATLPTTVMNPGEVQGAVEPDPVEPDEHYDRGRAKRAARDMAAAIDPATISISDEEDDCISFAQIWKEGESARNAAAKSPKTRSKRRR